MHRKHVNIKVIIFLTLLITVFVILTKTVNTEIPLETGILGTMYTFFYGLFINSIFKFLDEKYVNFRLYLGELIGRIQSVYNLTLLTKDKKFTEKMRQELIEFTESFNKLSPSKYYLNQENINKIYQTTEHLKVNNPKQAQTYSRMLQFIDSLSASREKLEIFGNKHLTGQTQFILISTSILYIIIIAFITFSKANLYMNLVGILLISMVIFVMILMSNLDNLSYGMQWVKTKNLEEMVEMMKK